VVAVAASAGGVEALTGFVASLPADFPAAVLVVLHIPPTGISVLPRILDRAGKLPARHPRDGEPLTGGVILVAPPDRHLAVDGHRVRVLAGPAENGHRPAADVLLRSVGESFGPRSAGVVLSGTMDDGAAGLRAVGTVGGLTLVQDPGEAAFPHMPQAAIEVADPQVVAPATELVAHLTEWLAGLPPDPPEADMSTSQPEPAADAEVMPLTCPDCGGTLWLHDEYGAERFRCRVGHTFSTDSLLVGQQAVLERTLWAAVVALEERADMSRRVQKRITDRAGAARLERYQQDIDDAERQAHYLREMIRKLLRPVSPSYHGEGTGVDPAS
jgi:two-component system, chemotaxis family, protein-glutamate methylesterase/glutaminase